MVEGDDSFKRPGAVPFSWEIQPGVPKTRTHDPTLLQPPKKLPPLRLRPSPPSSPSSSSSSSSSISVRPVSPFAPPPSFKLKQVPDSDSHSSGPPTPYFQTSSPRAGRDPGASLSRWRFPKSLFGLKKSKSGDWKKIGRESTSSECDRFCESETPSEDSSQGSIWSSPKSSPIKRIQSDLSFYEKKPF